MDLLRNEFLADTGLSKHEHGHLGRGDALDQRQQAPQGCAASEDPRMPWHSCLGVQLLDQQQQGAHGHHVSGVQDGPGHGVSIDPGAVVAAQVFQFQAGPVALDGGMAPRDPAVVERTRNQVLGLAPEQDRLAAPWHPAAALETTGGVEDYRDRGLQGSSLTGGGLCGGTGRVEVHGGGAEGHQATRP